MEHAAVRAVRASAVPWHGDGRDDDRILDVVGDARVVLLGEASHGTTEFYAERARITRLLIERSGFSAVAAEADWPDAWRVDRFVRGHGEDASPRDALAGFRRFPSWMWRNEVVEQFVAWLRTRNASAPVARQAGFYGIDLYSLHRSIEAVLAYLAEVDPEAEARARGRYACFDHAEEDGQRYGYRAALGLDRTCEEEAVRQLLEVRERARATAREDDGSSAFYAAQNALVVANAERYYRAMFGPPAASWNLRDRHMAEMLDALLAHLSSSQERAKVVVWAHNSHIGDARATEMSEGGELNLGQLARERYGRQAVNIGFTTYTGSVTAASDWGGDAERKRVTPALPGSWEELFHRADPGRFLLPLRGAPDELRGERLERAIGVVYRPQSERRSHYFDARIAGQFDAVIHLDETRALVPLERTSGWEHGELPETYPTAV